MAAAFTVVVCCAYLCVALDSDGNSELYLEDNQLSGSIPDSISTLTALT
jgi:hypothetical protein